MTWSSDWSSPQPQPQPEPDPQSDPWRLEELREASLPLGEDADVSLDLPLTNEEADLIQRQAELEEAYAKGFSDGMAEAKRTDGSRMEDALMALTDAVETIHDAAGAWTRSAKEHVVALAITVARHVIDREVKADMHTVADLVRKALTSFPIDEALRIRVNPQDLSAISTANPGGRGIRIAPGRNVQWVADPDVATGGCVVEGRRRVVDGRVDLALERIYRKLLDD
jgi:flagellar biosynthesis/type III secretory pathway protein FliH